MSNKDDNQLGNSLAFVAGAAISQRRREKKEEAKLQVADQLKKFSDLAKEGIITQEEFEKQKAKLLEVLNPQSKLLNFFRMALKDPKSDRPKTKDK